MIERIKVLLCGEEILNVADLFMKSIQKSALKDMIDLTKGNEHPVQTKYI